MTNEQIAHDLAVTFAGIALNKDKDVFKFKESLDNADYIGAAYVLTKEYKRIYSEILNTLGTER